MGMFDSFLKAIEDGSVEKALSGAVDKLESSLDKAAEKAESVTAKVEQKVPGGESRAENTQL